MIVAANLIFRWKTSQVLYLGPFRRANGARYQMFASLETKKSKAYYHEKKITLTWKTLNLQQRNTTYFTVTLIDKRPSSIKIHSIFEKCLTLIKFDFCFISMKNEIVWFIPSFMKIEKFWLLNFFLIPYRLSFIWCLIINQTCS